MSDIFAQLNELRQHDMRQHLPEQYKIARVEVGRTMLDWLKATAQHEGTPPEDAWRPIEWTPPPPGGSLFGAPVVLREDLEPDVWRVLDHDGEIMKEGTL